MVFPCLSPAIQVAALKAWEPTAEQAVVRVAALAGKPVAEIDFSDQLTKEKTVAAQIETDVKDAKRRINAAKGPKGKRGKQTTATATHNSEDDEDDDESE